MIPVYLNNLHLPQVFSYYTSNVDLYIKESCVNEHIVDSEISKISGFVSSSFGTDEDNAYKYFSVINNTSQPYSLIQIDNGVIKSSSTKKCDCAIVNGNVLCLIEFKANANSDKSSQIHKNYKKAIEQIETTIAIFNNYYHSVTTDIISLRNVEAFICFRRGYPRKTTSQMNYQVSFAENNNGIPLSFEREKKL